MVSSRSGSSSNISGSSSRIMIKKQQPYPDEQGTEDWVDNMVEATPNMFCWASRSDGQPPKHSGRCLCRFAHSLLCSLIPAIKTKFNLVPQCKHLAPHASTQASCQRGGESLPFPLPSHKPRLFGEASLLSNKVCVGTRTCRSVGTPHSPSGPGHPLQAYMCT